MKPEPDVLPPLPGAFLWLVVSLVAYLVMGGLLLLLGPFWFVVLALTCCAGVGVTVVAFLMADREKP